MSTRRVKAACLAGAMAIVAGLGGYLVAAGPLYLVDESSHVGYVLVLQDGVVPSVETMVPTDGDPVLHVAVSRPWPYSVPFIHIANNPPYPYLTAVPVSWLLDAVGEDNPTLLAMRLVGLAGSVASIGFAYLLGRELTGDSRLGLTSAALLAGVAAVSLVAGPANVDGAALAATTATTWMLARYARTRARPDAWRLGACCAAAGAVRPMSLAFAAGAGLVALVLSWRADGVRALPRSAVALGAPTVVVAGWFYALNVHRYGDPTGSSGVLDAYGIEPAGSFLGMLTDRHVVISTFDFLVTGYSGTPWWEASGPRDYLIAIGAIAVLVGAVVLTRRRSPELVTGWLAVSALLPIPLLLIARHAASGGASHPRYLLPMVPILVVALVVVLDRVHRYLPIPVVALAVLHASTRVHAAIGPLPRNHGIEGTELHHRLVAEPVPTVALVVAAVGGLVVVASLSRLAGRGDRST